MVMKHLEERANEVSDNAWNRDRKNLLAMFAWLRKIKGVIHNPVINIDRLPEERKADYIPPGEDINFEKQWYRLWTKKRLHSDNQVDYFPLPEGSELYKALKWQWEHRDKNSPYVFPNPDNGARFTQRRRFMKGLCERAGVKPFGFKAFRKYGPSVLNDVHKVSMKKLQTLLRHQNQKTTEIYLKKVDNDLSASMMLLEKRDTQGDTQTKKGLTAVG